MDNQESTGEAEEKQTRERDQNERRPWEEKSYSPLKESKQANVSRKQQR